MTADIAPGKYACAQTKTEHGDEVGVVAIEIKGNDLVNNLDTYLIAQKVQVACNEKHGVCTEDCEIKKLKEMTRDNLKEFAQSLIDNLS